MNKLISFLLAAALLAALTACSSSDESPDDVQGSEPPPSTGESPENREPLPYNADLNEFASFAAFLATLPEDDTGFELENRASFSPSRGLDEFGYFVGVNARSHVDFGDFDRRAIEFPPALAESVSDGSIDERIWHNLEQFPVNHEPITDRAVENGDVVNIDFRGYINGVAFEGGDTDGEGAYVTAGSRQFIDDFLDQIIGVMPGDTIDVTVSFPEHYPQNPDLQGQPALFVTTVNYIVIEEDADDYVRRHFSESHGWTTMEQYRAGIREEIAAQLRVEFLEDEFFLLAGDAEVNIPDSVLWTCAENAIRFHLELASDRGFETFGEYLSSIGIMGGVRELAEREIQKAEPNLHEQLVIQAIAEEDGIRPTPGDVRDYFRAYGVSSPDAEINAAAAETGMPYLFQHTLMWLVFNRIAAQ
jgi:trigger factor